MIIFFLDVEYITLCKYIYCCVSLCTSGVNAVIFSKSFCLVASCTLIIKGKRGTKNNNGRSVYCLVVTVLLTETKIHLAGKSRHSRTEFERHSRKKRSTGLFVLFFNILKIRHRHNVQPNVVQQTKTVNEILQNAL